MRLELADSTGCPVPQFIIKAESDADRMLLKAFTQFRDNAKDEWVFWFHGSCVEEGAGVASFNFGWQRKRIEA